MSRTRSYRVNSHIQGLQFTLHFNCISDDFTIPVVKQKCFTNAELQNIRRFCETKVPNTEQVVKQICFTTAKYQIIFLPYFTLKQRKYVKNWHSWNTHCFTNQLQILLPLNAQEQRRITWIHPPLWWWNVLWQLALRSQQQTPLKGCKRKEKACCQCRARTQQNFAQNLIFIASHCIDSVLGSVDDTDELIIPILSKFRWILTLAQTHRTLHIAAGLLGGPIYLLR